MTAADPITEIRDPFDGKGVVLYDGSCPLCLKSVSILKKLDWFGALRFQNARETNRLPHSHIALDPKRLIEEMHLLTPDRKHAPAGFKAFRWMAWRLPPLWPVAPLLYIPGVPWLGNKVYLWIAKNRFRLVPCHDGVCHVPVKG